MPYEQNLVVGVGGDPDRDTVEGSGALDLGWRNSSPPELLVELSVPW